MRMQHIRFTNFLRANRIRAGLVCLLWASAAAAEPYSFTVLDYWQKIVS